LLYTETKVPDCLFHVTATY